MNFFLALLLGFVAWVVWENSRRKTHPVPPGLQTNIALPHTQEFELYHNAFSLCSMKARVCMAELGIPYVSHHVDLIETGSYENIRPAFLAVNPGGTVPVLVHAGHPIYESHEQIRYAALHAPAEAPRLVPEDAALRAEMDRWIDRSSLTEDPLAHGEESAGNAIPGLTVPIFAAMIADIPFWKIFEGLLFHFDKKRPLMFIAFKVRGIEKLSRLAPAMRVVARSHRQMGKHLDALEECLAKSGGPWILGDAFTLADVSWLVIFERLHQVAALPSFLAGEQRPACAAYWAALTARASYRDAILAHSHPTVVEGTRRLEQAKARDPMLRAALEPGAGHGDRHGAGNGA